MQPLIGPRHQQIPLLCTADTSQYMWANLPIAVALVAVGTWIFLHVDIQAKNIPGKGEPDLCLCCVCCRPARTHCCGEPCSSCTCALPQTCCNRAGKHCQYTAACKQLSGRSLKL